VLLEEEHGRRYSVLYDAKFPKVHCIAPHAEPELIKFYLDDLDDALRRSGDDPILTLRRYGPQLIASDERLVSLPITESTKQRLLERFVEPCDVQRAQLAPGEARTRPKDKFAEHIGLFVAKYVPHREILRDAGPKEMFGYAMADFGTIAIAVRKPRRTIMIDGVDLQLMSRKGVISRATEVSYKFWRYGRLRSEESTLVQTPFSRIGVVFDGPTLRTKAYYHAHDFALHQFEKDADIAVDTLSGQGTRELEEVLTSEG
jgi:hypothetical protein